MVYEVSAHTTGAIFPIRHIKICGLCCLDWRLANCGGDPLPRRGLAWSHSLSSLATVLNLAVGFPENIQTTC
jgi:hypothetical protein